MKMTAEFLQDAIGFIGDDLIMNGQKTEKRTPAFRKTAAIAACFVIVTLTAITSAFLPSIITQGSSSSHTQASSVGSPPYESFLYGYWHNGKSSESAIYISANETFTYYTLVPTETAGIYDVREQYGSYTVNEKGLVLYYGEKTYAYEISKDNEALLATGENEIGSFSVKSNSLPEKLLLEYLGGLWICGDINAGTSEDTAYYFTGDGNCNIISFSSLSQVSCQYSFDGKKLTLHSPGNMQISYSGGKLLVNNNGKTLEYYRAALAHSLRLAVSAGEEDFICPNMYIEALIWSEHDKIDFPLPGNEIFKNLTPFKLTEPPRFLVSHHGSLSYTLYTSENVLIYKERASFQMPQKSGIYYLDVRFESTQTDAVCNGRILHYYITVKIP